LITGICKIEIMVFNSFFLSWGIKFSFYNIFKISEIIIGRY